MNAASQRRSSFSLDRRRFLAAGVGTALLTATPSRHAEEPPFDLAELTIADLRAGMASGKFTARSLAEKYLARIDAIDRKGPTLRSVIEVNPDALAIADALDRERKEKGPRGPLHGIPVLIKDNIDTADRMATTAGSLALVGAKPPRDAFAGRPAAQGRGRHPRQDQPERVGQLPLLQLDQRLERPRRADQEPLRARPQPVRLQLRLGRRPSPPTSAPSAVGTETDGSIVCPASVNGIVGLKPTVGLVSRSGIIPISHSQDTAGPMARTVRDAAILLGALAGADPDDAATAESVGEGRRPTTRKALDRRRPHGARSSASPATTSASTTPWTPSSPRRSPR